MPLPVAHSLIGASIVTLALRRLDWRFDWRPILIGALLGLLPDFDLLVSWGLQRGIEHHGTYTHSILFAVSCGSVVALLRGERDLRVVAGYISAVLSHGVIDALTKDQFGGAALVWPLSTEQIRLGLLPNYEFYPNPSVQGWLRILLDSLPHMFRELKLYLPVFMLVAAYRYNFGMNSNQGPTPDTAPNRREKSGRQGSQ